MLRDLVWHPWRAPLTRAQHLEAVTVDRCTPAVVGRAVHAEHPAGLAHARLRGVREELQAEAEQHVIIRHVRSLAISVLEDAESVRRTPDGAAPKRRHPATSHETSHRHLSGDLRESPR